MCVPTTYIKVDFQFICVVKDVVVVKTKSVWVVNKSSKMFELPELVFNIQTLI